MCVLADKLSGKFGMPALLLFMFVGMLFGSDGILKIPFDDYEMAENICSVALVFIMFYGGFNTKWTAARRIAAASVVLSTAGVAVTAALTGLLCHFVLGFTPAESFLIGAVLSSTDAASVFSILRQKKLNLKNGTASLLEMESGSNDPMSYMLTTIAISFLTEDVSINVPMAIFTQMVFGAAIGLVFAAATAMILTKTVLVNDSMESIFMIAMVLLCCGTSEAIGGNQYLSVYLMGIIVGNSRIRGKKTMIPFFDGITGLAQIVIFFLLGLLSFPHRLPSIILPALAIACFLTIVARPAAVFVLLTPFAYVRRDERPEFIDVCRRWLLISWAGLRGAASIVFAIMVIDSGADMSYDLFHIVFMVSLFSVAIQGTLLPAVSKKLQMVDEESDVLKTFNDYQEESAITLMRMYIPSGHNWENKMIKEVSMPTGSLAIMVKRGGETVVAKGDTVLLAGDSVILNVPSYEPAEHERLEEIYIDKGHKWCDKAISELDLGSDELITVIIRGDESLIPDGGTIIREGDIVAEYWAK